MKKISLQEIYNKYLGKVSFPDTTIIFFYEDKDISFNEIRDDILIDACNNIKKENLTKHNSRTIQSANPDHICCMNDVDEFGNVKCITCGKAD